MLSYLCCSRSFPPRWRYIQKPWRWVCLTVSQHEEYLCTHSLTHTLCKYHHIKCIKPHLVSGMLLSFLHDWQGSSQVNTKRMLQSSLSCPVPSICSRHLSASLTHQLVFTSHSCQNSVTTGGTKYQHSDTSLSSLGGYTYGVHCATAVKFVASIKKYIYTCQHEHFFLPSCNETLLQLWSEGLCVQDTPAHRIQCFPSNSPCVEVNEIPGDPRPTTLLTHCTTKTLCYSGTGGPGVQ